MEGLILLYSNEFDQVNLSDSFSSGKKLASSSFALILLIILSIFVFSSNALAEDWAFPLCNYQSSANDITIESTGLVYIGGVPNIEIRATNHMGTDRSHIILLGYLAIDGNRVDVTGDGNVNIRDGITCVAPIISAGKTITYHLPLTSGTLPCILQADSISFEPIDGLRDSRVWLMWDVTSSGCGDPTSCPPGGKTYGFGSITITKTVVTASSNSPCPGEDIRLTGKPDGLSCYSWTGPNGFTSNEQNPTINNADSTKEGVYTLRGSLYCSACTDQCSCSAIAQTTVTLNANPTVTVADVIACGADSATLTAVTSGCNAYTYQWYNGAMPGSSIITGATSSTYSPTASGTYTVKVTCPTGCSAMDDGSVTFRTRPIVTVNNPTICAGSQVTLTAQITQGSCVGMPTYVWKGPAGSVIPGATGASLVFSSATLGDAGSYTVEVSCSGCTGTGTGVLTVQGGSTVTVGEDMTICISDLPITLEGKVTNVQSAIWSIVEGDDAYGSVGLTSLTQGDPSIATATFTSTASTGFSVPVHVKLTVTPRQPCSGSLSAIQAITVLQKPAINIIVLSP
jgi:hypothetical protein